MSTDTYTRRAPQAGITLVEMVIFIAVISVGLAGVLLVMNFTTRHSADPMIRMQALLIAESYMEEIILKRFIDPPTAAATNTCPTPEGGRTSYDNICDFNNFSTAGARDQFDNAIPGLESYNVAVTVSAGGTLSVGPAANPVNNTGAIRVLRIDVTVTNGDFSLPLTAYRLNYNCSTVGDAGCKPL